EQHVDQFLSRHPAAEPTALAAYLVEQGLLTEFQAERVLKGKTQGFVLGPFTVMHALGAGSMGTVYKATSKKDGNWYAVKVMPRRSMWSVRLARRVVRAFGEFQHPAVVPFVDAGTAGGLHYLTWPFVEGQSLDLVVGQRGPFSPADAARIGLEIA